MDLSADGLALTNLVPALKEGLSNLKVFGYQGSLPTPPCFESVTWLVFRRPVKVNPMTVRPLIYFFLFLADVKNPCTSNDSISVHDDIRFFMKNNRLLM